MNGKLYYAIEDFLTGKRGGSFKKWFCVFIVVGWTWMVISSLIRIFQVL